jgi:hypothetical protein
MIRSTLIVLSLLCIGSGNLTHADAKTPVAQKKARLSRKQLIEQLKAARKARIEALKKYVETGEFPWGVKDQKPITLLDPHFDSNHSRTHRFRGSHGKLCALAYLIWHSGDQNLVSSIEKRDNHFCLGIDRNAGVEAWILKSGLTKEECIQIQRPGFRVNRKPRSNRPAVTAQFQKQQLKNLLSKVIQALEKGSEKSVTLAANRILNAKQIS